MKNWIGNKKSIWSTLGSSSHSIHEREKHDYYATDPKVIDDLLKVEQFEGKIWEPACGEGHLSKRLIKHGFEVYSSDLIFRGYGEGGLDFLKVNRENLDFNIITNPPYKFAQEFIEKSLQIIRPNKKIAMFLKLQLLEGQKRKKFFEKFPPCKIYVFSKRQKCALNGQFDKLGSSAVCYAWFIWQKGIYKQTIIDWI